VTVARYADSWTRGAASRHTNAITNHIPVPLKVEDGVGLNGHLIRLATCFGLLAVTEKPNPRPVSYDSNNYKKP